jgi:hypothetical protein
MPTTLINSLTSDYMAATSALFPKGTAKEVLVYVEGNDDKPFWSNILAPLERQLNVRFNMQTPTKGKKWALKQDIGGLGLYLIICVDSDYDYLLQDATEISRKINNSDYIFQTYSYSIENLQCYSGSLQAVWAALTQSEKKMVDFDDLLRKYSQIVYRLFLWSFYFYKAKRQSCFTIAQLSDAIQIHAINSAATLAAQVDATLQTLKNRVKSKEHDLESSFAAEKTCVEALSENLKTLGVTQDNTYLFARGHTIKDVVVTLLRATIKHLLKSKDTTIANKLSSHAGYKACFLYGKIEGDLKKYSRKFKITT